MKKVFCLAVALCIGLAVSADANGQCPVVSDIYGPSKVEAGGSVSLKVLVSRGDPNVTPTYNWTVSAGSLAAGKAPQRSLSIQPVQKTRSPSPSTSAATTAPATSTE